MNKTMEKEYKWRADEKLLGQALLWASSRIGSQSRTINMESSYFDTADGTADGTCRRRCACAARTTAACAA